MVLAKPGCFNDMCECLDQSDFVIKLENIVADIRILEPCSNSCALVEGCVL